MMDKKNIEKAFTRVSMRDAIATGKVAFNPRKESCTKNSDFSKKVYVYTDVNTEMSEYRGCDGESIANDILRKSDEHLAKTFNPVMYMDIPLYAIRNLVATMQIVINNPALSGDKKISIQRNGTVMNHEDASWIIISLLNAKNSIPEVIVYTENDDNDNGSIVVIDGQQRVNAITTFMMNQWCITGTDTYLDGLYFKDFPKDVRLVLENATLHFHVNNRIKEAQRTDDFIIYNERRNTLKKGEQINARLSKCELYHEIRKFAEEQFAPSVMKVNAKQDKRMEYMNAATFALSHIFLEDEIPSVSNKATIIEKMIEKIENEGKSDDVKSFKELLNGKNRLLTDAVQIINLRLPETLTRRFNKTTSAKRNDAFDDFYIDGYTPLARGKAFSAVYGPALLVAVFNMLYKTNGTPIFVEGKYRNIFVTEFEKFTATLSTRNPSYRQNYCETIDFVNDFYNTYLKAMLEAA